MKKILNYCLFLSLLAAGTVSAKPATSTTTNKNTAATPAVTTATQDATAEGDSIIKDGVYDSYANPFNTDTIPDDIFSDDVYADELAAIDVSHADDIMLAGKEDAAPTTATLPATTNATK